MSSNLSHKWKEVMLGEVAEFINGRAFNPNEWETKGKMIIRIQDLTNSTNSPNFTTKTFEEKYLVKKGDVLISWSATLDAFIWNKEDGWLNQHIFKVKEKKNVIDKIFLFYLIKTRIEDFKKQTHGSTMKHITKGNFTAIKLFLPPLPIQQKIVSILEKVDKMKKMRKEADKLTKDFLKAVFLEMFGDPVKNNKRWVLKKLGQLSSVGSSKRVFVNELVEEGIPFYRGTEIGALSESSNISPKFFITEEHYLKLKENTGVPVVGDLLLPSICFDGRIWQVETKKPFYFKDGRVLWIHLDNPDVDSTYLQYLLHENFIRNYNQIASGTTFSELKIFALKNLDIMMPPISLQNTFASIVKEVKDMKEHQEQSKEHIDNLFSNMIQNVFKRELTC